MRRPLLRGACFVQPGVRHRTDVNFGADAKRFKGAANP